MSFNHFPMRSARAVIAADPRLFGRADPRQLEPLPEDGWMLSDDLKLFGSTFAAGFLFVSILIA
jgi:hypothetical protein